MDVRGGGARRDEEVGVAGHGLQLGQGGGGGRRRSARSARGVLALLRDGSNSINSQSGTMDGIGLEWVFIF